ncbi:methyltransferase [Polyangium spumosum]|uniref:Methyltransferase n=1 Tax=Polyangium spumosum TaxID=889282 RepID=A0A6N7Q0C8_9BACT|nr:methyltransferase [Polyangium spumosum]MRG96180.1 methyltransferase [Polyangium spumosum]
MITPDAVERALHELFIAAAGTKLRREDQKKSIEVAALLGEIERHHKDALVVDAAAGKAYVGLVGAALLGFSRVHVIEREASRIAACEAAAARLGRKIELRLAAGDVGDASLWPEAPDVVVALHACGPATDTILDAASHAGARWMYVVPCCYAASVPFAAAAEAKAEAVGIPRQAEVRRRFVMSLVDAERALRLEAAGYEVTITAFVPPTVTPHNLLFRARRVREPGRMREAAARLERLRA